MYVKAIIILCVIAGILILYLFFRGSSNGSRVSSNRDSVDKLKESTRATEDIYSELEKDSKSRRDITDEIESNNGSAESGISEALGILRKAKDRNNN